MARKPLPVLTGIARRARQEQTVQDPAIIEGYAEERRSRRLIGAPASLRVRPVEIVPEAKPDYILRREQRQAFADRINGGPR